MEKNRNTRHHYIPLSLGGVDHWCNIMFLSCDEHKKVHQTLNIPYDRIRAFRKATNGMLIVNQYYLQELMLLQLEYFKNFENLTLDIQTLHCLHIEELCDHYSCEWNIKIAKETAETPKEYFFKCIATYYNMLEIRIKRNLITI